VFGAEPEVGARQRKRKHFGGVDEGNHVVFLEDEREKLPSFCRHTFLMIRFVMSRTVRSLTMQSFSFCE
jgi:hypothetical protein